ncbi:hypothetical protein A0O28_0009780 [Trichoderma guizhouense]|uniref:Uncharacterized protein n=1 Tax=Trichoderma guizhouense TaxID=1491466 RepID=A0A1T3CIH5_9HYPO|nr:hypothetical protein A0O28_0009780 [Trichoderma guizhouense]
MASNTTAIPQLALEVNASPRLSLTLPYDIEFTLRRIDDDSDRPCIVRWSPGVEAFSAAGLELWRHTNHENGDSLVRVQVDYSDGAKLAEATPRLVVQGREPFLCELWPGGSGGHVRFTAPLHERYHKGLIEGERYDLVWPGGEVAMWDWGTKREHVGRELRVDAGQPPLHVPAGCRVSFTAAAEAVPWPGRAACEATDGFLLANVEERWWRNQHLWQQENGAKRLEAIAERERVPSTPFISTTLECPSTVIRGHSFDVTLKVTYEGLVSDTHKLDLTHRCITFHTYDFQFPSGLREGFRLWHQRRHETSISSHDDDKWVEFNIPDDEAFLIADDPPVVVRVGDDLDNFVTLRVGETWTFTKRFDWSSLPDDAVPGDVFSLVFQGTTVDWWDWGSQEHEHRDTVVKLPCWIVGPVVDPTDNGGRPRLVVPRSARTAEFTVVVSN